MQSGLQPNEGFDVAHSLFRDGEGTVAIALEKAKTHGTGFRAANIPFKLLLRDCGKRLFVH